MSLIDEALKRAQAAGPVPAERAPAWTPTHLPQRRTSAARVAFPIAAALVALTAAAWLFLHRGRPVASRPPSPARAEASPPTTVPAEVAGRIEGPEVIVPPPVVPPAARRSGSAEISSRPKSDETKSAPAKIAESHPLVSSPATPAHAAPKTLADGKSYSGEISLPNGAKIELDGIVFSDTNPVALLNGRVIAPGGSIEGMTVARVEPDRVELQGNGVTVFLLVK